MQARDIVNEALSEELLESMLAPDTTKFKSPAMSLSKASALLKLNVLRPVMQTVASECYAEACKPNVALARQEIVGVIATDVLFDALLLEGLCFTFVYNYRYRSGDNSSAFADHSSSLILLAQDVGPRKVAIDAMFDSLLEQHEMQ